MSRILAVIRRDFQHLKGNTIALLVCVGLIVMPSLYAWFNIAGGWDPYANTNQIKVALTNSDEGYTGSIIPFRVNVGERVVTALTGNEKIGYVITSEEDAVDGVSSGEYYAAVVIPKNFTTKLLSVLTNSPSHPQLDYYVNEKRNAIASIVTNKASGSIQTLIDEGFTEAVSQAVTELMGQLSGLLDGDTLLSVASSMNGVLDESLRILNRSADDIEAYKNVVASIRDVVTTSDTVLGKHSASFDAAGTLAEAASGVEQFNEAATTAKESASAAISEGAASVSEIETAIDEAFSTADGKVTNLVEGLEKVIETANTRKERLQELYNNLEKLSEQIASINTSGSDATFDASITVDISDVLLRLSNALTRMDNLIATSEQAIADVQNAQGNAAASKAELEALAAQARTDIEGLRDSFEDNLSGSLDRIAAAINAAASEASNASATLQSKIDQLSPALSKTATDLQDLESTLDSAASKLKEAAGKIESLRNKLSEVASSGDVDMARNIFSADPTALVDFLMAPVDLEREAVYSIENNGSAMAPYYTTMALWVGGTLMGILIYAALSKRALEETGAAPRHAYLGRLAVFLAIGFCQSTMLLLGDLFFLKIQCAEPVLFILTGWIASTVFINIIYALSVSFGDVGKAIGVLFMVVQVAGSGGTFPVEMLPPLFQKLYSFLPFVYSENAFREAICGVYDNHWIMAVGTLALYLIPALLLGLVLRKPVVRVNEWIEEHLEETKFM
ncbi:MAG: YhgE/Pip domain-containing protein [Coriobacteriales bacterium]|nr:YhgE/Pip domain-containing protein [Coriobacteriales bacterium]